MSDEWVGILGATSFVGGCVFPLLLENRTNILAFSRSPRAHNDSRIVWRRCEDGAEITPADGKPVEHWISAAPIWVLPQYFELMARLGARRVVALSSTSRFTKEGSSDPNEQETAKQLAQGESKLKQWGTANRVEWIILRPTLIYGLGRDRNLTEVARFIRRFRIFPLFGAANGLRQPIHVEDLAGACVTALHTPRIANRAYNLSGGEILPYRDMVGRVFNAMGQPPWMLPVPLIAFRMAVSILRLLPRYRNWTAAMAERMNRDLIFDHSEAAKDLAFNPRSFQLSRQDVLG